jgi:hypothetical protein
MATRDRDQEKKAAAGTLSSRAPMPTEDDRPATRKDINQLRTEFHGDMDQFRIQIHGDIDQLRNKLVESMRDMQTEVLRAFHSWARPIEIRLRSFDDMQQRLGLLEERVSNIERDKASN